MALRERYDFAVLGDSAGALLSGCLASRLGLSVLVLPLAAGVKSLVSAFGQCFDPEPNYLIGLGYVERGKGLIVECLEHSGASLSKSSGFSTDRIMPQVLTPSLRLGFSVDNDLFGSELDREFGADFASRLGLVEALSHSELPFVSFWGRLPERLTLPQSAQKRIFAAADVAELNKKLANMALGFDRSVQKWFKPGVFTSSIASSIAAGLVQDRCLGEKIEELLRGLWFGATLQEADDPVVTDLLQMLVLARTGAMFRGGMSAYRTFLLRLAESLGADVYYKSSCKRIFVEDGRVMGVQVANRGSMISVDGAILGCSLSDAHQHMSESGSSWVYKLKEGPVPYGWRLTIALTVKKEAIPPGMGARAIWQEAGAPALEIEVALPSDYSLNESGNRLVFLRTIMPFDLDSLRPECQRLVAARMLRQVAEVMPFVEDYIIKVYPDFRVENAEFSEVFGFAALDLIPENLCCFKGCGVGSSSGIDRLFVATGESYPSLGPLGPTVAALEAVALTAHRMGLAGPFV